MEQRFLEHINKHFPFLAKAKLLIAISGGVDSVVLTHLCDRINLDIALAHCNFNLRGEESDADERFVRDLAKTLNKTVYVESFETKTYVEEKKVSTQMAARTLRYDWFGQLKELLGFDYVLTAHQADDNLETFLINLSRGTGLDGLTGIPEVNNYFVRPLLPFSRREIEQYALENKIKWREDSSNKETKYLRNKLRLDVIPALKQVNPGFLSNFQNTIKHLQEASGIINDQVEKIKSDIFNREGTTIKIPVESLIGLNPRKAYLYELFKEFGFTQWNDVENLLFTTSGKQLFSAGYRMLKNREELLITPINSIEIEDYYSIESDDDNVVTPLKLNIYDVVSVGEFKNEIAYLDKDLLKYPLTVRKWQKGDYFYPIGMKNKKRIAKFFKDEKFSIVDKENTWLLCSEDNIVWIINHRLDDRYKVKPETKNILKIEYLK